MQAEGRGVVTSRGLSLREVLSWLKQYEFTRCIFETDSKLLQMLVTVIPEDHIFMT